MAALGIGLDFALCYMLQLGDDHAILNTYVQAYPTSQREYGTSRVYCSPGKNTVLFT